MKRVLIVGLAAMFLSCVRLPSQSTQPPVQAEEWQIEVVDLVTGLGVPNVVVDGRTSRVQGVTDAQGFVTLQVGAKPESIVVHGNNNYGYHVGEYDHSAPRRVFLVPNTAYHKTPLIPRSGTVAPVVFQGVTRTVLGPNPYTIEVEVPAGVLPVDASFWILPVPSYASPYPKDADRYINSTACQFAVELRDAQGRAITDVLPDPGIIVRSSPTWYPYSLVAAGSEVVKGAQYRLTKTSGQWSHQPERSSYDPATGMFTAHLKACSWWVLIIPAFFFGDRVCPDPKPALADPPPLPEVSISKSGCVVNGGITAAPVVCGVVTGGPATVTFGTNGTFSFSASTIAALKLALGIAPSQLMQLITRINASIGVELSASASGGVDVTLTGTATGGYQNNQSLGRPCYSGEVRVSVVKRPYTLTVGANSYTWNIPEGILLAQCLTKDSTCGENCINVWPDAIQAYFPSSYKLCNGDSMKCW
jgi:hypothetical protein